MPAERAASTGRPLVVDLVLLTAVLLGVTWWVGTDVSYSIDEPATILQAQRLAAGEGWLSPNPLPTIDPESEYFYLVLSDRGTDGVALYAKHPAYPVLLAVADGLGGRTAMVLVSVAGAVAAAAATAGIARRIDPRLARLSLWAAGAASPLLFDSQLVIAHTAATALAGGAVLLVLPRVADGRPGRGAVAGTALALAAASFLRTEAVLFALVLAGWAVLRAVRDRERRLGWTAAAAAWALAGLVPLVVDRWLVARIVGGTVSGPSTLGEREPLDFLATRIGSTVTMLVAPGESWAPGLQLALVVMGGAAAAFALILRTARPDRVVLAAIGVVMVAAGLVAALAPAPDAVPGILLACPLVTIGLLTLTADTVGRPPVRVLTGVSVVYAAAVALTQYAQAGGIEWGARYLALTLPLLVPVAVASLTAVGDRLPGGTRAVMVTGVVALSALMSATAVRSLRSTHDSTRGFAGHLAAATERAPGPDLGDGDRRPVVVATGYGVGRLTTGLGPPVRGLTVQPSTDLPAVAERLRAAGVERFVLAAAAPDDAERLRPHYRVVEPTGDPRIVVMGPA
jgi:hypothetical protein